MTGLTLAESRHNLDLFCASHAQPTTSKVITAYGADKAAEKAENLITRTLGVLQEHGVYAAFLWLAARTDKDMSAAAALTMNLQAMINAVHADYLPDVALFLQQPETNHMLQNLAALLLVKRVMERTLIYARYHAKAEAEKGKVGSTNGK